MTEFTKDYTKLIALAKENGDTFLAAELTRQMNSEAFLQDESLQRAVGKRTAELLNAKKNGTSFEGSTPGKKI